MDWYTLRVISGKEKKIKESIIFEVNDKKMQNLINKSCPFNVQENNNA